MHTCMTKWLLGHFGPSSPTWVSNFSCYFFYSWFLPKNIKHAKGNECNQYKSTATISSSNLPICLICFHLVMPRHVLSPCYAQYGHTRGMKGYVTYYLAYVRLQVQILPYYMRLRVQNMPGCQLKKYRWGKWADQTKKSQLHFCTDCIHFLWHV